MVGLAHSETTASLRVPAVNAGVFTHFTGIVTVIVDGAIGGLGLGITTSIIGIAVAASSAAIYFANPISIAALFIAAGKFHKRSHRLPSCNQYFG